MKCPMVGAKKLIKFSLNENKMAVHTLTNEINTEFKNLMADARRLMLTIVLKNRKVQ